jgi:hypothetical protein
MDVIVSSRYYHSLRGEQAPTDVARGDSFRPGLVYQEAGKEEAGRE